MLTSFKEMEKFKAIEKEMKTKAYSKEGLLAGGRLDPKEKEKADMCNFISGMVDELDRQVEQLEAEVDSLNVNVKKSKKDNSRAERIAELDEKKERHKWHQSKLEQILRSLENGGVEVDTVKAIEEDIKYYVESNREEDFVEDDSLYDDLNLQDEDEMLAAGMDGDHVSSQDAQSIAEEADSDARPPGGSGKQKIPSASEQSSAAARRPSMQLKSPLPALATLHQPLPAVPNGVPATTMKPAPPPTRAPGELLKYASAAAAAAASDKNGTGIAPLPAPPNVAPTPASIGLSPLPTSASPHAALSTSTSPSAVHATASAVPPRTGSADVRSPAVSHTSVSAANNAPPSLSSTPVADEKAETSKAADVPKEQTVVAEDPPQPGTPALTNGDTHSEAEEESIYHLPSSLSDLLESFEATRESVLDAAQSANNQRLFTASAANAPQNVDVDAPRYYRPQHPFAYAPDSYPTEPLSLFDNTQLYTRLDTDTLFYLFYYRQGTYQQFLAARALKSQSWRFHKQYSTWFQRHEEPKKITDEFEQGTYRFFDYESTW